MLKKTVNLACLMMILGVLGCTYGQDYFDEPQSIIRDPHFSDYKAHRDRLESSYLNKEITYAEYIEQKDRLDEKYAKEVQERNDKINPDE